MKPDKLTKEQNAARRLEVARLLFEGKTSSRDISKKTGMPYGGVMQLLYRGKMKGLKLSPPRAINSSVWDIVINEQNGKAGK